MVAVLTGDFPKNKARPGKLPGTVTQLEAPKESILGWAVGRHRLTSTTEATRQEPEQKMFKG